MRRLILGISVAALLSACGSSNSASFIQGSESAAPANPAVTTAPAADVKIGGAVINGPLGAEPTVEIDTSAGPATDLGIVDIAVGTGTEVTADSTVTAHYVGYGAASGQMFDGSWSRGEPATFPLGNVIVGWQEGLQGMKVGGRRALLIPAEQAYGDTPPPGSGIAAGETLLFVVDLVDVQ